MMIALALLQAWVVGLAVVIWLWQPRRGEGLITVLLGAACGLALAAGLEFVLQVTGLRGGVAYAAVQGIVGVIALACLAVQVRRRAWALPSPSLGIALLLAAPAAINLLLTARLFPHGRWDGWAIWNLRASFIYLGGAQWRDAFHPLLHWSHPDYPLLLPLSVVRLWRFVGSDSTAAPLTLGLLFSGLLGLAMFATVRRLRGSVWAWAAMAALLCTPALMHEGPAQMADVPLALYLLLSAFVMIDNLRRRRTCWRRWCLLGLLLGAMAWTKNEGLSLALAMILTILLLTLRERRWQPGAAIGLGMFAFLVMIAWQRTQWFGQTDVFQHDAQTSAWSLLLRGERHLTIVTTAAQRLSSQWIALLTAALLLAAAICSGRTRHKPMRRALLAVSLAGLLHIAACYGIYLLTPHDLTWHVRDSVQRLVLQLWPTLLLLAPLCGSRLRWRTLS